MEPVRTRFSLSSLCTDSFPCVSSGVYLCIRCSGIHRGMGTHVSRVKSIDLDMWTPEQMEVFSLFHPNPHHRSPLPVHSEMGQPSCKPLLGSSSQSRPYPSRPVSLVLGNATPFPYLPPIPRSKMESFIRSKYESRRWAKDGPPPSDPSVLEGPAQPASNGDASPAAAAQLLDTAPTPTSTRNSHAPTASLSVPRPASPSIHSPSTFRQNTVHSHSQSRQLLSAAVAGRVQAPSAPSQPPLSSSSSPSQPLPQQQQQPRPQDDLFSLDFHAPPSSKPTASPQLPTKDVKQDILSLFSAAPAPAASAQSVQPSNAFGQFTTVQTSWDAFGTPASHGHTPSQSTSHQPMSMMGTTGTGQWGVSSGWNGTLPNTTPSANIWGAPAAATASTSNFGGTQANAMNTTDIWGGSAARTNGSNGLFAAQPAVSKKDDIFGDLWGDFK